MSDDVYKTQIYEVDLPRAFWLIHQLGVHSVKIVDLRTGRYDVFVEVLPGVTPALHGCTWEQTA